MKFIFKSSGHYLGFVEAGHVFSRDNVNLGWVNGDGSDVWDSRSGEFRGKLREIDGHLYILKDTFLINPVPRPPKRSSPIVKLPNPPGNISPINLPLGTKDAY